MYTTSSVMIRLNSDGTEMCMMLFKIPKLSSSSTDSSNEVHI